MFGFGQNPDDGLHNRRLMAVYCFLLMIVWGVTILVCTILYDFETSKVVAFLSFVTTISGTGILGYLHASSKDDYDKLFTGEAAKMALQYNAEEDPPYEVDYSYAEGE